MMRSIRFCLCTLIFIFCSLFPVRSVAAPITFVTALPVARGEMLVRAQAKLLRATDDDSPGNRALTVWAVPVIAAYGITGKLALFGVLPVLDKEMEVTTPLGRMKRGDSGIGDLKALARYTIWKKDGPGKTLRLAPFMALKVPTGQDDATDSIGRLPRPLQLGSGSWDYTAGLVLTRQTLARQFDGSLSYTVKNEADGFEFGDEIRFDLSYQHRLWPRQLSSGVVGFVYGVLESTLIWQDNNTLQGIDDPDSGGVTWYLSPGIQM